MSRALRVIVWSFVVAVLISVAAPLLVYGVLQTRWGQSWLAGEIAKRTGDALGGTAMVSGLSGHPPFRTVIDDIVIRDESGAWLHIEGMALDISARELLSGRLVAERIAARRIHFARLPERAATAAGQEPEPFAIPKPPLPIVVKALSLDAIEIEPAVLGERVQLAARAAATLDDAGMRAEAHLRRTDGISGEANLTASLSGSPVLLDLDLLVDEPTGLAGRLIGRTDRLPARIELRGTGPLADWHGRLTARLGGIAELDADLALTGDEPWLLAVTGQAEMAALLPADLAALASDPVRFDASVAFAAAPELRKLELSAGSGSSLSFAGRINLESRTGEGRGHLDIVEIAPLAHRLDLDAAGAIAGDVTLAIDDAGRQSVVIDAEGRHLRGQGLSAARMTAKISAADMLSLTDPGATVHFEGTGAVEDFAGTPFPDEAPRRLSWRAGGEADPGSREVRFAELALDAEGLSATGSGTVAGNGSAEGRIHVAVADLARYRRLLGLDGVAGRLSLDADVTTSAEDGAARMAFRGNASDARLGIAEADALIGRSPTISGVAEIGRDGALALTGLRIAGIASLGGEASFDRAFSSIDARFTLDAPDLAPLGGVMGVPLVGPGHADGTLSGPWSALALTADIASPAVTLRGRRIEQIKARIAFADLGPRPTGDVSGAMTVSGLPLTFRSGVSLTDPERLDLANLRLETRGSALKGQTSIDLRSGLMSGRITGDTRDLAPFGRLVGHQLGGAGTASLQFSPKGGAQGIVARASATGLRFDDLRATRIDVSADLVDPFARPRGQASISGEGASAGDIRIDRFKATLSPTGAPRLPFSGTAEGDVGAPFSLTVAGALAFKAGETAIDLARLDGRFADAPVQLADPTRIVARGDGFSTAPVSLTWGDARISGSAAYDRRRLAAELSASRLPIKTLGEIAGRPGFLGEANMTLSLTGTPAAPEGAFDASLRGFGIAGEGNAMPKSDIALSGRWHDGQLEWQANGGTPEKDVSLTAKGRLPLRLRPGFVLDVPQDTPFDARIDGSGNLALVDRLLDLGEDQLSGACEIALSAGGTLATPRLDGTASIRNGRYENFISGAVLRDLTADLVGGGEQIEIRRLDANDGGKGKLQGSGRLALAGDRLAALDLKVTFDRFRVLRRDEARATASGKIAIGGPLQKMTLSGETKLDRLEIQIPDRLPASAPKIEVEEIHRQAADLPPIEPTAGRGAVEPSEEPALDMALDLIVRMPEVYIRGRGLDSEWRGKIKVAGTTKAPDITGRLELQRGTYALVGKPMQLTRGLVIFPGGPKINPDLDIVAERQTRDVLARVELKGNLQSPKIDLSSTPPLPPDEVLSRVMFDKGTGQIGPGEAVQLAQAAAVLSGSGGPDLLGKLRNRFKLDQLGISASSAPGAEETTGSPAVTIGKRITEDVHVGVEQGAAPGSSSVNVEVDITPNISVGSEVGSAGRSGVGVRWKRDY